MRVLAATLMSLILALAGTACGEDRDSRAVTVDDGGSSKEDDAKQEEAPASAAGMFLSKAKAQQALLTVPEMPTGYTSEEPEDDDEDKSTYEPAKCKAVFEELDKAHKDADVKAEAGFVKGGAFGIHFTEEISSFKTPVADDAFDDVIGGLKECSSFTTIDPDGTKSKFAMSALSFPNLGDKTLALSGTIESEGFSLGLTMVAIQIDHNIVSLASGGITGSGAEDMEAVARAAVKKLESVASK